MKVGGGGLGGGESNSKPPPDAGAIAGAGFIGDGGGDGCGGRGGCGGDGGSGGVLGGSGGGLGGSGLSKSTAPAAAAATMLNPGDDAVAGCIEHCGMLPDWLLGIWLQWVLRTRGGTALG